MAKNDTNIYGMNVSGSDTTPDQFGHFFRDLWAGSVAGMAVSQNGTPNMTVVVAPGSAILTKNTISSVVAEVKADTSVVISTASVANPRIDAIIVYEDTSVTITPYIIDGVGGRFKVASVVGTPGASPVAPTDGAIQTEIGAGKPWARLANVTVPTSATSIINSNMSDQRSRLSPAYLADSSVSSSTLANGSVTNSKLSTSTGELGGAWQTWTPTWTGVTVGNATVTARYTRIGKTVHAYLSFQLGTTSSITGAITFSLPVAARTVISTPLMGQAYIEDNSTAAYAGNYRQESTTIGSLRVMSVVGSYANETATSATVPFTWANTDFFTGYFTYEAA